jgi:hypothetical protein
MVHPVDRLAVTYTAAWLRAPRKKTARRVFFVRAKRGTGWGREEGKGKGEGLENELQIGRRVR